MPPVQIENSGEKESPLGAIPRAALSMVWNERQTWLPLSRPSNDCDDSVGRVLRTSGTDTLHAEREPLLVHDDAHALVRELVPLVEQFVRFLRPIIKRLKSLDV